MLSLIPMLVSILYSYYHEPACTVLSTVQLPRENCQPQIQRGLYKIYATCNTTICGSQAILGAGGHLPHLYCPQSGLRNQGDLAFAARVENWRPAKGLSPSYQNKNNILLISEISAFLALIANFSPNLNQKPQYVLECLQNENQQLPPACSQGWGCTPATVRLKGVD